MKHLASKKFKGGKIEVKINLSDDCKNGIYHFSITADIYELRANGRYMYVSGGCQHEEIKKHFPEFSDFIRLHLSNVYGQPMYTVENGLYYLQSKGVEGCAEYLRISTELASQLSKEKDYFKYQLFTLGIVDQWKSEADAAIKHLEELTGKRFVNPYEPENEKFVLRITDEEKQTIQAAINAGYYTPQAIQEKEKAKQDADRAKRRAEIVKRYDEKIRENEIEKAVYLYIFDQLGTTDNIIYYSHSNRISFNWQSYGKMWTQEFINFVNGADMSALPEGVKFEIK